MQANSVGVDRTSKRWKKEPRIEKPHRVVNKIAVNAETQLCGGGNRSKKAHHMREVSQIGERDITEGQVWWESEKCGYSKPRREAHRKCLFGSLFLLGAILPHVLELKPDAGMQEIDQNDSGRYDQRWEKSRERHTTQAQKEEEAEDADHVKPAEH